VRITKVETIRLEQSPADAAAGVRRERNLLWVRVHTDEGHVGLGETYYGARTVEAAVHELFSPLLIGRDPLEIERHWTNMFRLADHFGYGGAETRAISAIDIALWDIFGQAVGRPIYELLGGACRRRIPVYDTGGGPNYPDDPVPYVEELLDRGVTAMKVGAYPAAHEGYGYELTREELERIITPIAKIADAFGDRMSIAVDGHGFWGLPAAIKLVRMLEPFPILWFEEMISARDATAHLELQRSTRVPICGAERLVTRYAFADFVEKRALEIVMPDLVWTGGISEVKKIVVLAETHQLPVCPHDCTGPVNLFACAHICMNAPNAWMMETSRAFHEDWYPQLVTSNVVLENGCLLAPEGAGLGTKLREEVLARPDATVRVTDTASQHYMGWRH
jgi:galactonate dehydratase